MTSVSIAGSGLLADRIRRDLGESGLDVSLGDVVTGEWLVAVSESAEEQVRLAERAVGSGSGFVSAATDPQTIETLLELDGPARESGAKLVVGAGWSPGCAALLAHAAMRGRPVRSLDVSWVISTSGVGAQLMVPAAVRSSAGNAVTFREGSWRREKAGTDDQTIFFPEPVGWREVKLVQGAEASLFPKTFGIETSVVTRGGFVSKGSAWLSRRITDPASLSPRAAQLANSAGRVLPLVEKMLSSGGGWCAFRVDVSGMNGGASLALVDQPANLCVTPIVATILELVANPPQAGAHLFIEAVDADRVLRECARRGLRPAILNR